MSLLQDRIWVKFLLFIWIVLANTMSSICRHASSCPLLKDTPLFTEITKQNIPLLDMASSEMESFVSVLQSTHANLTSKTVLGLFQVLHQMVKYIINNANQGGELEDKFILLSVKFLQNLPWDFYGNIDFGSSKFKAVLSGCILQFVCSLVQKNDFEDSQNCSMEVSNLYLELGNIVPNFLSCFFGLSDEGDKGLVQYMRHKTLVSSQLIHTNQRLQVNFIEIRDFILFLILIKLRIKRYQSGLVPTEICLEKKKRLNSLCFYSCFG